MILIQSGGVDSTYLQYKYAKKINAVIHFNYGQASFSTTYDYLKIHCRKLQHELFLKEISLYQHESSIFVKGFSPKNNVYGYDDIVKSMGFINGRGLLFLSYAVDLATCLNEKIILIGAQHDPFFYKIPQNKVHGDTSYLFLLKFQELLNISTRPNIKISTPLIKTSKSTIIKKSHKLFNLEHTYSCELSPRCGKCNQCRQIVKNFTRQSITTSWFNKLLDDSTKS